MSVERLQQAVFRMQHDPGFARRVLSADAAALRSAGLSAPELAALRAVAPGSFSADRDGKRIRQFLRNVSSEFRASVALGPTGDGGDDWIAGFPGGEEFHACVAEGGRFPLAFAAYAARVASEAGTPAFGALVSLEAAMVEARRGSVERPVPAPGEAVLAPWVRLVETPAGTHALASALQSGARAATQGLVGNGHETVLLVAGEAPPPPGGLRELRVEGLTARVADFLREAERPRPVGGWRDFAGRYRLPVGAVEAVARDFVSDGVLVLVSDAAPAEP